MIMRDATSRQIQPDAERVASRLLTTRYPIALWIILKPQARLGAPGFVRTFEVMQLYLAWRVEPRAIDVRNRFWVRISGQPS